MVINFNRNCLRGSATGGFLRLAARLDGCLRRWGASGFLVLLADAFRSGLVLFDLVLFDLVPFGLELFGLERFVPELFGLERGLEADGLCLLCSSRSIVSTLHGGPSRTLSFVCLYVCPQCGQLSGKVLIATQNVLHAA